MDLPSSKTTVGCGSRIAGIDVRRWVSGSPWSSSNFREVRIRRWAPDGYLWPLRVVRFPQRAKLERPQRWRWVLDDQEHRPSPSSPMKNKSAKRPVARAQRKTRQGGGIRSENALRPGPHGRDRRPNPHEGPAREFRGGGLFDGACLPFGKCGSCYRTSLNTPSARGRKAKALRISVSASMPPEPR